MDEIEEQKKQIKKHFRVIKHRDEFDKPDGFSEINLLSESTQIE